MDNCYYCGELLEQGSDQCDHCGETLGVYTSEAVLADQQISEMELQQLDESSQAIARAYLQSVDLRGAVLGGIDLNRANLAGADLQGADLGAADLSEADLSGANLRGVNFLGANLTGANLAGADLGEANMRRAQCQGLTYNNATIWPVGFDPILAGAINESK